MDMYMRKWVIRIAESLERSARELTDLVDCLSSEQISDIVHTIGMTHAMLSMLFLKSDACDAPEYRTYVESLGRCAAWCRIAEIG